jgi:hypothetical protein
MTNNRIKISKNFKFPISNIDCLVNFNTLGVPTTTSIVVLFFMKFHNMATKKKPFCHGTLSSHYEDF